VVQSEILSSAEAPDRKLYTVTPAGRTELRRWFLAADESAETGREELFAKIMLALTGDVDVTDVLQAQRKGQLRRIGQLTELKEQLDPDLDLSMVLQLDLFILKTEAVIRWLNTAETKIEKSAALGPDGVTGGALRPEAGMSAEALAPQVDRMGRNRR